MAWTENDVPDQTGRTAFVTGATGGLGRHVAEVLARRGARVLLASRDAGRGERARAEVAAVASGPEPEVIALDTADLASVRAAADDVRERTGDRLDLLVNNAGIMAPPLGFSVDGIENQWATNVLGPAALTWSLVPALRGTDRARVVFVSSLAHLGGRFDAERLERDAAGEGYSPFGYYGRTKAADLLLARELERYFRSTRASAIAVGAHPGVAATNLISSTVSEAPDVLKRAAVAVMGALGQPAERGALPILMAATAEHVRGGQYFGPRGVLELAGAPTRAARSPFSRSDEAGADLIDFVERWTGVPAPR